MVRGAHVECETVPGVAPELSCSESRARLLWNLWRGHWLAAVQSYKRTGDPQFVRTGSGMITTIWHSGSHWTNEKGLC